MVWIEEAVGWTDIDGSIINGSVISGMCLCCLTAMVVRKPKHHKEMEIVSWILLTIAQIQ